MQRPNEAIETDPYDMYMTLESAAKYIQLQEYIEHVEGQVMLLEAKLERALRVQNHHRRIHEAIRLILGGR